METKTKIILALEVLIFTAVCILIKFVIDTKNIYIECRDKPVIQEVGYYRCSGTKKNPKYCPIPLEE